MRITKKIQKTTAFFIIVVLALTSLAAALFSHQPKAKGKQLVNNSVVQQTNHYSRPPIKEVITSQGIQLPIQAQRQMLKEQIVNFQEISNSFDYYEVNGQVQNQIKTEKLAPILQKIISQAITKTQRYHLPQQNFSGKIYYLYQPQQQKIRLLVI